MNLPDQVNDKFLEEHVYESGIFLGKNVIEPGISIFSGDESFLQQSKYAIAFQSFEHRWSCDIFKTCNTWYSVYAFVINNSTGQRVRLKSVETAIALQRGDNPPDYNPRAYSYYKQIENVDTFNVGPGRKKGHDPDVWGIARCYFETGEIIGWRWHSYA